MNCGLYSMNISRIFNLLHRHILLFSPTFIRLNMVTPQISWMQFMIFVTKQFIFIPGVVQCHNYIEIHNPNILNIEFITTRAYNKSSILKHAVQVALYELAIKPNDPYGKNEISICMVYWNLNSGSFFISFSKKLITSRFFNLVLATMKLNIYSFLPFLPSLFLTHEYNPSTKLITGIKYFDQNIKFVVRSYLLRPIESLITISNTHLSTFFFQLMRCA